MPHSNWQTIGLQTSPAILPFIFCTLLVATLTFWPANLYAQKIDDGEKLYRAGEFAKVIAMADEANEKSAFLTENWSLLKAKSQFATGDYESARATVETGLSRFSDSIRLRWLGAEVYKYAGQSTQAKTFDDEIADLWKRKAWRYRDIENVLVVAEFLLAKGADPKTVLDQIYNPVRTRHPEDARIFHAIGELALSKNDFQLAAKNFAKAIEFDPSNPDAHVGHARAWQASDTEKFAVSLDAAMKLNPNHVDALLLLASKALNAEDYEAAESEIGKVLKVNPNHPLAWAYRAAIAHLNNDPASESKFRGAGLKHWPANPAVDHLIGKQLSRKYRFRESSVYQRRALVLDKTFMPAKIQLAHDLLRLGQELEGWKLAEEIFDADQYNVVANNMVVLRDNMSKFATIEHNGFVIRMDRHEASIYSQLVIELLDDAETRLAKKYDVELQKPVFIEIFSAQQDFAIRTFGLPGGAGFLGVCFGRVVTMNSPAAQGASLTNWRSVLWHEFCHVVTLQKTENKMPRWLSEGISVYEEGLADTAWADKIGPEYRAMILSEDLTPVSKLSGAFLNPKTAKHLQFAYFESSIVVAYLIEEYGEKAMVSLLNELRNGTPINAALTRHMAPIDFLDRQFSAHIKSLANEFGGDADWTQPDKPLGDIESCNAWLEEHPDNFYALLKTAALQLDARDFDSTLKSLDKVESLVPALKSSPSIARLRAIALRKLEDRPEDEIAALEEVFSRDADDMDTCTRLLEIFVAEKDWGNVKRIATRIQGINPMVKSSHLALADVAEKTDDDTLAIKALSAIVSMEPFDRAEAHYRLAEAQTREKRFDEAKRNVLLALDVAPRFQAAHKLLLEIVSKTKTDQTTSSSEPVTDTSSTLELSK